MHTVKKAEEIAAELNEGEDKTDPGRWTYKVLVPKVIVGPYPATVQAYDENGEKAGQF